MSVHKFLRRFNRKCCFFSASKATIWNLDVIYIIYIGFLFLNVVVNDNPWKPYQTVLSVHSDYCFILGKKGWTCFYFIRGICQLRQKLMRIWNAISVICIPCGTPIRCKFPCGMNHNCNLQHEINNTNIYTILCCVQNHGSCICYNIMHKFHQIDISA